MVRCVLAHMRPLVTPLCRRCRYGAAAAQGDDIAAEALERMGQ